MRFPYPCHHACIIPQPILSFWAGQAIQSPKPAARLAPKYMVAFQLTHPARSISDSFDSRTDLVPETPPSSVLVRTTCSTA